MALSDIRTKVRRTTDKVRDFSTADIDDAVNEYQIDAWLELDKVAPWLTRKTENVTLVVDDDDYTLTATDFLRLCFIKPPASKITSKIYAIANEDQAFYQETSQTIVRVAQRGAQTFIFKPAPDAADAVVFHFTYKPATITTSVAPTIFDTDTLSPGAIAKLFWDINFPDAQIWEQRAARRLKKFLELYQIPADPANLSITVDGRFFDR